MTIGSMPALSIANTLSSNYEAAGESMVAVATGTSSGESMGSSNVKTELSICMLDMALETQKGINLDVFA